MRKTELKINVSKSTKPVLKRTTEEDAMIKASYKNGMGITEIANQLGVSRQVMLSRIKGLGVWERKTVDVEPKLIIDLCMSGKTLPEIVQQTGSTEFIIRRILKENKIKCVRSKTVVRKFTISKDTLQDLYITQNLTAKQISEIYGCKTAQVYIALTEYGIRRPVAVNVAKNVLYKLYIESDMSLDEVSLKLGLKKEKICRTLKKYGIRKRAKFSFSITEHELRDLYVNNNLTRKEIARRFDVTESVIQNRINQYKIQKLLEIENK
ncbi:hypothetical protein EJ576_21780 [Pseudomonas sp. C 49-2]|uniref:hypothetical protein n=1 Tax=Pseudomonas sp. C 49-2 TaxID=2496849 RepID=UPI000F818343|nr:hypothetical protein [Pseudomonas sp. C 49-2]RTX96358.1 hypothetical protein EJ576_21780 [Pseudomonas sp. C 49-2]